MVKKLRAPLRSTQPKHILFLMSPDSQAPGTACKQLSETLQASGCHVREVTNGEILRASSVLGQPNLIVLELEACGHFLRSASSSGRLRRTLLKNRRSKAEAVISRLASMFDSTILGVTANTSSVNIPELKALGVTDVVSTKLSPTQWLSCASKALTERTLKQNLKRMEHVKKRGASTTCIGPYTVIERLGEGASGVVYKAQKEGSRRTVALKLLKRECADFDEIMRFRREIAALGRVNHPNIVNFIESGVHKGCYYFVMTFVNGEVLHDQLTRGGALAVPRAVKLLSTLAAALQALHERGFVHRDVKPANILMSPQGPVLTDFGVVRNINDHQLTQSGVVIGTPGYISPEVIKGGAPSHLMDIFALGMLATELLLGRDQFGENIAPVPLMGRVLMGNFIKPSHLLKKHAELGRLLDTLVALDPSKRCQSARDFLLGLKKLAPVLS